METNKSIQKGSQTAKNGFANEKDIVERFENWQKDNEAQKWLKIMGYELNLIKAVKAVVIHGHKADINVQIFVFYKEEIDTQNIQVKLVSNKKGFNQIDKRWIKKYQELWHFDEKIERLLQLFTGELPPIPPSRNRKRMFIDEFPTDEQSYLLSFLKENKFLILSDIIKGRGEFSAEWVLVAQKTPQYARWVLKNINEVLQHYGSGDVRLSPRGSILIGKVTMQRKGGDGGRDTAKMLQFKINPAELFNE